VRIFLVKLSGSRRGHAEAEEASEVFGYGLRIGDGDLPADGVGVGGDDGPGDEVAAGLDGVGELGAGAEEGEGEGMRE
jgi:hypothetical protein